VNMANHKIPASLVATTWLSILALFADSTNLTDVFPSQITYHFEEADLSDDGGNDTAFLSGPADAPPLATSLAGFPVQDSNPLKHVYYDQDSPSLAATQLVDPISFSPFRHKESLLFVLVEGRDALYLWNKTLLI
jgi:hypothetical protein